MPPRVAPQQVVVIPIPNAKMTGDDKQVRICVTIFNKFVCVRTCACVSACLCPCVCDFLFGPGAKQLAVVSA